MLNERLIISNELRIKIIAAAAHQSPINGQTIIIPQQTEQRENKAIAKNEPINPFNKQKINKDKLEIED